MKCFVLYDKKSDAILEFMPQDISASFRADILEMWQQDIPRKILKLLTLHDGITSPVIKEHIGHSMSTLHDNINKMEKLGLLTTTMVYTGNKQRIISTNVMCVSKNTKLTQTITRFLNQGLWVDTERWNTIEHFLQTHGEEWVTAEEISAKTGIQLDEVKTLLDNWDSQITRSFSHFLRKRPFEKKILYRTRQEE